jgi:hypothetical protein
MAVKNFHSGNGGWKKKPGSWRPLRQIDQRVVAFAVCRFARREVEGYWSPSGITDNEFYW